MRWSMAVALSRFGTFGPLHGIHSSSTDAFPNTATLTFYKQKYASPYLTFAPVEAAPSTEPASPLHAPMVSRSTSGLEAPAGTDARPNPTPTGCTC